MIDTRLGPARPIRSGRVATTLGAAVLILVAGLAVAGPALGANPNATQLPANPTPAPTLNPGQVKKATPTPPPAITPAPTVAPTPAPTVAPAITLLPTPAPTPAPTAATVPSSPGSTTPTPGPASGTGGSGGSGSTGGGAAGTTGGAGPTPALTEGPASASSPSPEATDTAAAAGSTIAGSTGSGGWSPLAVLGVVGVVGLLAILAGWFAAGRRSSRDDRRELDPRTAGLAVGRPAVPRAGLGASATIARAPLDAPLDDPLMAAIARSRAQGDQATAGPIPSWDGSVSPEGPLWVRRLDPRIPVMPTLGVDPERDARKVAAEDRAGRPGETIGSRFRRSGPSE